MTKRGPACAVAGAWTSRRHRAPARLVARLRVALFVCGLMHATAHAARAGGDEASTEDWPSAFSFAVVASATTADGTPETTSLLRAIGDSEVRFVVQFETGSPTSSSSASSSSTSYSSTIASCSDEAIDRRGLVLDASPKPLIPIAATSEWADCGATASDPFERLQRLDDTLFTNDQSLGQERLPWFRQSATARFRRYRENVRWQVGRVLFATINLPDNNNDFRIGAGRNGEFEERLVANRAWLQRTFRLAVERKMQGIVLFVDAEPRFEMPWRTPDLRSRERDGYYEWKVTLREVVSTFAGKVLLVQGQGTVAAVDAGVASDRTVGSHSLIADHPLRDVGGRPLTNLARIVAPRSTGDARWLRVSVDPTRPDPFGFALQRVFDDPSGELYGPARIR